MKAVILAGGLGTRLMEETKTIPKPMVEIGGKPILWHIMKIYSSHGINEFIVCCGYKGYVIKEYFYNYFLHRSAVTIDIAKNKMHVHQNGAEPWRVTLVDTGEKSQTGGRLKRVLPYLNGDDTFCFTYGDGVGDVDITKTIEFHRRKNTSATLTAVLPRGRFGSLAIEDERVTEFREKVHGDGGWMNAGFFVLSPSVGDLIEGDDTTWEYEPLQQLAKTGDLSVYKHHGFWQPMDTLRDKQYLENLWETGEAQWKTW